MDDAISKAVERLAIAVLAEAQAKDALRNAAAERRATLDALLALSTGQPQITLNRAAHLYWRTEVPVNVIAGLLGLPRGHVTEVSSIVGPWYGPCPRCGYADAAHTSRTAQFWSCPECDAASLAATRDRDAERDTHEAQVRALKVLPYPEYLQSEHWYSVRRDALRRAGYRCQLCGRNVPLDVHHNTYERRGEEQPRDVIALCRDCHARHHDR